MRFFVTGISGFAGRHLAAHLLELGHAVGGVARQDGALESLRHPAGGRLSAAAVDACDIRDRVRLREALGRARPDGVFHLAAVAFVPKTIERPELAYEVNFLGTVELLAAVREIAPRARVVLVTTGEIYGAVDPARDLPILETQPLRPLSPYSVSKAAADLAGFEAFWSESLDVVRARPFNHTGPGQLPEFVCSEFARALVAAETGSGPSTLRVGNLDVERDFSDVRDVVRGYVALFESGAERRGVQSRIGSGHPDPHDPRGAARALSGARRRRGRPPQAATPRDPADRRLHRQDRRGDGVATGDPAPPDVGRPDGRLARAAPWRGALSERKRPGLSIVLPAYNEEANVASAVTRMIEAAEPLFEKIEVVVVDDGSRDATAERVREIARVDPRVRLLQHAVNRGYGAAVTSGLRAASQPLVFYTDSDLQFDPRQIHDLVLRIDEFAIAIGYRKNRQDPWFRKLNAWGWNQLQRLIFGLTVRDVDCAFKLFHREVLEHLPLTAEGAFFSSELLLRARAAGYSFVEVPVDHFPRRAGSPTGARLGVIGKAFREMWHLRRELKEHS